MIRKIKTTLVLGIIAMVGQAQNVEFKASNFKDKKDEFKKAVEEIKQGDEFYEQGNEAVFNTKKPGKLYKQAIMHYKQAQKFNPNNAELNFKIGVCYAYTTQKYRCTKFLQKANELDPEVDPFMPYYLGVAYQLDGEYDKAMIEFKKFESEYKKADNFTKFVKKRKQECEVAKGMEADEQRVWVDNVKELNSANDDFSPTITTDGEQLIFTSNRMNGKDANAVGEYDMDIYVSSYEGGKWSKVKAMGGAINTVDDDFSSNLSYDGTKMLMFRDVNGQYDIFETFLKGANWSAPVGFAKAVNTDDNQTYASYFYDDIKIFYLNEKTNGLSNGADIYFSGAIDKIARRYGSGRVIGKEVNSKFHEGSVYMHPDGETLYFSSEGHNSMGGKDIFMSRKIQGQWSAPTNLGYPINTQYDDEFFAITASSKYAYIASNRPGGKGGMDIYKVTFWGPEKELFVDTEDFLLASALNPIQDNEIRSAAKVERKSLTVFKGKTIDAITKKPVEAKIEIIDNGKGTSINKMNTNSATGKFLISLQAGKNYGIAVKADGYLFHSENFDIEKNAGYNLVDKVIELKNIKVGSKIALRNIFFETGKAILRSESNKELDRLVKLMKDVPSLQVEISGHTDNTGSAKLNDKLSQDRAQAVVTYLTGKGINKSRMAAKGYGSREPVATNNSSEGRQQNRRVEFKITGN